MILAIVESWSFKVPWIVNWIRNFNRNFVFFFFFFKAQFEAFRRRKRNRWILKRKFPQRIYSPLRVSLFPVSLSYLYMSMETFYEEKIIQIFSRTKNSSSTSIVDFLFKLVIVSSPLYLFFVESFVPLLSNNSWKQSVAFTSEMQLQRVKHCQGIFSSIIDSFNLVGYYFSFRKLFLSPISVIFTVTDNKRNNVTRNYYINLW